MQQHWTAARALPPPADPSPGVPDEPSPARGLRRVPGRHARGLRRPPGPRGGAGGSAAAGRRRRGSGTRTRECGVVVSQRCVARAPAWRGRGHRAQRDRVPRRRHGPDHGRRRADPRRAASRPQGRGAPAGLGGLPLHRVQQDLQHRPPDPRLGRHHDRDRHRGEDPHGGDRRGRRTGGRLRRQPVAPAAVVAAAGGERRQGRRGSA